jgi:hypothetical protein
MNYIGSDTISDNEPLPSNSTTMDPGILSNPIWAGDSWIDVPFPEPIPVAPKPVLTITSVSGALYYDTVKAEITIHAGTQLIVSSELSLDGTLMATFSDNFRMPVQAIDGREKIILSTITNGIGTTQWTPKDSGTWLVTEALINRDLPSESHIGFSGLKIFVLEA